MSNLDELRAAQAALALEKKEPSGVPKGSFRSQSARRRARTRARGITNA
jgi:hypothetical protein